MDRWMEEKETLTQMRVTARQNANRLNENTEHLLLFFCSNVFLQLPRREKPYLFMQLGPVMYFMHSHITTTNTLISTILLWLEWAEEG